MNIYNLAGEVVGQQELNPSIFGVAVNPVVVQQVLRAQMSSRRKPWAHTKTRSEVRGGGKKPWAQKGTGRARQGSTRSPQWKGGGVAFGPRNDRNYASRMNKKTRQLALRMVLADKVANQGLVLVNSLALPEIKTKQVALALSKLPRKGRTTMFVLDKESKNMSRSARNLADVMLSGVESLNVRDLMKANTVILPVNALSIVEQLYASRA